MDVHGKIVQVVDDFHTGAYLQQCTIHYKNNVIFTHKDFM